MQKSSIFKLYALALITGVLLLLVATTTYEYVKGPVTHQGISLSLTGFVIAGNVEYYVKNMLILGSCLLGGILMTYRQSLIVHMQKKIYVMKEARKLPEILMPLVRSLVVACRHLPYRKAHGANVDVAEMTTVELLLDHIEQMVFQMAEIVGKPLAYEMRELLFSTATLVEPVLREINTVTDIRDRGITDEVKERIQKLKDLIRDVKSATDISIKDNT